jgi:pimeloyl-ACP methyl ester carboxylesterase
LLIWPSGAIALLLLCGFSFQQISTRLAFRAHRAPGRMIDIGGYKVHINCAGEGPSVVLESGFGGWSVDWDGVQQRVSKFARVCSYDRAGSGWSDRAPGERTTRRATAEDLHKLLKAADVPGPYVLVGHSLGGFYVREFARLYPSETAGLVFVDSSHEEQGQRASKKQRAEALSQVKMLKWARYLTVFGGQHIIRQPVSNGRDLKEPAKTVANNIGYRTSSYFALYDSASRLLADDENGRLTLEPIPDVPVYVLTSEKNLEDPDLAGLWRELQDELAELSPNTERKVAENSGHFIQQDRPELVEEAIRDVLKRSKASD